MGKNFKCSGIDRKKKCGKKAKAAAVVDDTAEEEHVPPQSTPREPHQDDTFYPSYVVDGLLLKSTEECGKTILSGEEIII